MPIRRDLLPLYRGAEYQAKRRAAFELAGAKYTATGELLVGAHCQQCNREAGQPYLNKRNKYVTVQLGRAHLDQNPRNDAPKNIAVLCRACHLAEDLKFHLAAARQTRMTRKDAARPLLVVVDLTLDEDGARPLLPEVGTVTSILCTKP